LIADLGISPHICLLHIKTNSMFIKMNHQNLAQNFHKVLHIIQ
jgi:hypothetical protein